jgi:hypothetical protein
MRLLALYNTTYIMGAVLNKIRDQLAYFIPSFKLRIGLESLILAENQCRKRKTKPPHICRLFGIIIVIVRRKPVRGGSTLMALFLTKVKFNLFKREET